MLGLTVDYAGTARAWRPVAQQAAAPGTGSPAGCFSSKTLTAGEAWLSIVGNTLTGKVDGEDRVRICTARTARSP